MVLVVGMDALDFGMDGPSDGYGWCCWCVWMVLVVRMDGASDGPRPRLWYGWY